MPPRAHAHGAPEEEEEVIVVRTDGPPFIDLKAKQGRGFEADFVKVQAHLGPGKITHSDFVRDLALINKVYVPTAHRSYIFLSSGTWMLMLTFFVLILIGIVGAFDGREIVGGLCGAAFAIGSLLILYSKWIEQGGIRDGAAAVRKLIEETINPSYTRSAYHITWAVTVQTQKKKPFHLGRQFMERPVVSVYALRSPNTEGIMTDWVLPPELLSGVLVQAPPTSPQEQQSDEPKMLRV